MRQTHDFLAPRILAKHDEGLSYPQIAQHLGKDRSTILHHMKKMGITPNNYKQGRYFNRKVGNRIVRVTVPRRLTEEEIATAKKMFLIGETVETMGRQMDREPSTFTHLFKRLGMVRKRPSKRFDAQGKPIPCAVFGCSRPVDARGYCHSHYAYYKKKGIITSRIPGTPRTQINRRSDPLCDHKTSSCECVNMGHEYTDYLRKAGYPHAVKIDD